METSFLTGKLFDGTLVDAWWKTPQTVKMHAGGAIAAGAPVVWHIASGAGNQEVSEVIEGTDANGHLFCGIYNGVGGTGSATTTSGLTGNDATDGDLIDVVVAGVTPARVDNPSGAGEDISIGNALHVGAGALNLIASPSDGVKYNVIAMADYTPDNTEAGIDVFLRPF